MDVPFSPNVWRNVSCNRKVGAHVGDKVGAVVGVFEVGRIVGILEGATEG